MLKEGDKAPDFKLPKQDGQEVSLGDFRGKWLVLYSYPKDNTPGCTIEAKNFRDLSSKFKKVDSTVVGISRDSAKSHCNFIEKHGLKFDLLTDEEHRVLEEYGAWGKKKFMGREFDGIIRSTFLITPSSKIAKAWYNVKVKGHADEVLEKLKELSN